MLLPAANVTDMAALAARYTAVVFSLVAATSASAAATTSAGPRALVTPSTYTVPGAFPTSVWSKYYAAPTATASQVQPVIKDPITVSATVVPNARVQQSTDIIITGQDISSFLDRPGHDPQGRPLSPQCRRLLSSIPPC
jgi:hypothetical protein